MTPSTPAGLPTAGQVRALFTAAIDAVAPGCGVESLPGDVDIRDGLDLDSMDLLNVFTAIEKQLGVRIPEVEQSQLVTIDGAVAWLARALATGGR
jgi:acyl carrier protein